MLSNIGDSKIGMNVKLADTKICRLGFSDNHFDERRLSCSICTQYGNTTGQGHFQKDVIESIFVSTWITKVHVLHFKKLLSRRLDSFQTTRIGELEFQVSRGEFKVVLGLWLPLDKFRHFALVVNQFAVRTPNITLFVMNDIGANLFHKGSVVGNCNDGSIVQVCQVINEPIHRASIQVICWFIEQKNIRINQYSTNQSQLHLPSSRQFTNGTLHHVLVEFQFLQTCDTFFLGMTSRVL
mmetsp:Transcript_13794/g.24983  ORF Transcript_13794/g.24983 Transcript_13794/m.24983 type:complete len:239 (-) Transcript_13794:636-1352(-)